MPPIVRATFAINSSGMRMEDLDIVYARRLRYLRYGNNSMRARFFGVR